MKSIWSSGLALALVLAVVACKNNGTGTSGPDDASASGAAAGSVGAALAGSSQNGTQARSDGDLRAGSCPTLRSAASGCATSGANSVNLTYTNCSFNASTAVWSGTLQVGVTGTGNTIVCGTFPFGATSTGTITRQFVNGTGAPSSATRTSLTGNAITVDHQTDNLDNYQGDLISANIGAGYGSVVTWALGRRTQVQVRQHVFAAAFDHSVNGTISITESVGASARTASGSLVVYHNKLKVKATSTFNTVAYGDTCCAPTGGNVTTTFEATSASGTVGQALVGKTETLTFTGCGTATLVDTTGASKTVAVSNCL